MDEWRKDARRDRDNYTTTVVYTMSVTTVSPTCTTKGYINHVCSRCGASYATDYTAALGHNYQYSYTQAPDYGVEGYDWYACTRCGAGYKDNIKAALWGEWVRMPSAPSTTTFLRSDIRLLVVMIQ